MHIIIFSINNLIFLVIFDMDSLDKSKPLDLHKIRRCNFRLTWEFLDLPRPTVGEIRLRKDGELFSARKKLCKTKLIIPIVLRFYLYIESENIGDRVGFVPSKSFDVRESIRDRNGYVFMM